ESEEAHPGPGLSPADRHVPHARAHRLVASGDRGGLRRPGSLYGHPRVRENQAGSCEQPFAVADLAGADAKDPGRMMGTSVGMRAGSAVDKVWASPWRGVDGMSMNRRSGGRLSAGRG